MNLFKKKLFLTGILFLASFVIWTLLLQIVDVQYAGVNQTPIGFCSLNTWFHKFTGVHLILYTITDYLGLIPIFVCIFFGAMGLLQLVTRKSLGNVDFDLRILGIYYGIVIACYLIFEKIPINYRPIFIQGRMEVSYPSSTTLLVLCVMPTLSEQIKRRMKNHLLQKLFQIVIFCFCIFMVLSRLFSGVHWLTDIIGAILFSVGLFCIYQSIIFKMIQKHGTSHHESD